MVVSMFNCLRAKWCCPLLQLQVAFSDVLCNISQTVFVKVLLLLLVMCSALEANPRILLGFASLQHACASKHLQVTKQTATQEHMYLTLDREDT